jgi:hypothetical protein
MIFFIDDISLMRHNFEYSLKDVRVLIELYDSIVKTRNTSQYAKYESLKRSSLFLLIASWENYIEDTLKLSFNSLLEKTKNPNEMKSTFNSIANSWLDTYKDRKPKAPDLILWTNDNWKDIIRQKIKKDIDNLNTPNSKNLAHLFKIYFDINLDTVFILKRQSVLNVQKRLDKLIRIRGDIAHQAKKGISKSKLKISLKYVKDSVGFIDNLVTAVENNFVNEFK